jgi:hypothetical protein
MSRHRQRKSPALTESERLRLALANPRPNPLHRVQAAIRSKNKPVLHQILEAEANARIKSGNDKEGYLEKRRLASRKLKEELSEKQEERMVRDKHDKHADYIMLSHRGKKRLRSLRFQSMRGVSSRYHSDPLSREDRQSLATHRSRVVRILDGKSPSIEIFEAMIPLFEFMRKRSLIRQQRAEMILDLIQKKVTIPRWLNKLDNVHSFLMRESSRNQALVKKYSRKIDWLHRMAGRAEHGVIISGAAEHFIREIHDSLQDYNVTN